MSKEITLGILYSGQLETQLIKSAKKIGGIKTIVLTDDKDGPAKHVADEFICADLNDKKVIENFVKKIDLCTYAFENLSYEILKSIADVKEVHPSPNTLKIAQNRILEKKFANELGIKTTEWKSIKSLAELKEGVKLYGNCILKSVSGGYDGKQQYRFKSLEDVDEKLDFSKEYVLEKFLNFKNAYNAARKHILSGNTFKHLQKIQSA